MEVLIRPARGEEVWGIRWPSHQARAAVANLPQRASGGGRGVSCTAIVGTGSHRTSSIPPDCGKRAARRRVPPSRQTYVAQNHVLAKDTTVAGSAGNP